MSTPTLFTMLCHALLVLHYAADEFHAALFLHPRQWGLVTDSIGLNAALILPLALFALVLPLLLYFSARLLVSAEAYSAPRRHQSRRLVVVVVGPRRPAPPPRRLRDVRLGHHAAAHRGVPRLPLRRVGAVRRHLLCRRPRAVHLARPAALHELLHRLRRGLLDGGVRDPHRPAAARRPRLDRPLLPRRRAAAPSSRPPPSSPPPASTPPRRSSPSSASRRGARRHLVVGALQADRLALDGRVQRDRRLLLAGHPREPLRLSPAGQARPSSSPPPTPPRGSTAASSGSAPSPSLAPTSPCWGWPPALALASRAADAADDVAADAADAADAGGGGGGGVPVVGGAQLDVASRARALHLAAVDLLVTTFALRPSRRRWCRRPRAPPHPRRRLSRARLRTRLHRCDLWRHRLRRAPSRAACVPRPPCDPRGEGDGVGRGTGWLSRAIAADDYPPPGRVRARPLRRTCRAPSIGTRSRRVAASPSASPGGGSARWRWRGGGRRRPSGRRTERLDDGGGRRRRGDRRRRRRRRRLVRP